MDDAELAHPPRPKLIFRVGVVGNRWDRLQPPRPGESDSDRLAATYQLERRLETAALDVLRKIGDVVRSVAETKESDSGYHDSSTRLALVTGLAEGADRIVAQAALKTGYEIWPILPFALDEYQKDFDERWTAPMWSRPGARKEFERFFDPRKEHLVVDGELDRYDRYAPLGRHVVSHSDLLVVISDQGDPRGAGGTANIVADAQRQEVPIVQIDPKNPSAVWLEVAEPGRGRGKGLEGLERRVRSLIEAPPEDSLREKFFAESPEQGNAGAFYRALCSYLSRFKKPWSAVLAPTFVVWFWALAQLRPSSRRLGPSAGSNMLANSWRNHRSVDPKLAARFAPDLEKLYDWADELAVHYAGRFRSSFTAVFSLAWIAAVVAVAGLWAQVEGQHGVVMVAAFVELATVALILGLTIWGSWRKYHEKWLDYRSLAERLRHLGLLWPLGVSSSFARMAESPSIDDPRATWVGWLYRAKVRELGFAGQTVHPDYLASCRAILTEEVKHQAEHHDRTAERLWHLHHVAHARTNWLFACAVAVALAHLAHLKWGEELAHSWSWATELAQSAILTLFSVFLPARAAALHGWAGHADFFGGSLRSAQIETRLEELSRSLDALGENTSATLGDLALESCRAMESELLAWHAVSRSKPLQAP